MFKVLGTLGHQVAEIWRHFGINQKVSIILALLVCLAALGALVFWSTRADYRVLYSGLTLQDAAAIREKIEDAKIPYQIRDAGRAVYVPAGDVYRARLLLAAEGLPKETSSGFELFEQPKFGLTDFAQQVNYQRALQGELEKTLSGLSGIQGARVTLVLPKEKLFASEKEKTARASVMLTLAPGATLSGAQVRSVTHLVASAVPGLDVAGITIVDQDGRLLSSAVSPDDDNMINATDQLNIQRAMETQLTKNVQEMLDAMLGKNAAVVRVSAAMDFSRVEQRKESYDKEGRVVKSERILSESSTKPGASVGGAAGTPVNVPVSTPDMMRADQAANAKSKKENIQTEYAVPSGVEHILQTGARVRRLSVSVAVARGAKPRTPEELNGLRDLVRAAVGYVNDPAGGRVDSVEVKEMEFVAPESQPSTPWWLSLPVRLETLTRGLLLSVLLIVAFLAGRRILAAASIQSAEIGVPVRSAIAPSRAEEALAAKEVDVDLFETMQAIKEDPKKAAAWIRRTVEAGH